MSVCSSLQHIESWHTEVDEQRLCPMFGDMLRLVQPEALDGLPHGAVQDYTAGPKA